MSTFTTSQQIAALAQNVTNLQGAIQGFRYQGLLYSLFGNCCATGMDVTTDLYPTVSVTSSSIATSTKITLGTAPTIPLVTGAYVEIDGHSGSVPALNGLQGPITVLTTTTFTIPVNVSTGGTGGTCHQVSMILSLNGQAVGDSAHLNPNGNSPPIRPEQYWNNALVYGEVFLRDQVNVGTLTDTNLTVTTAPGTGYHRYDAVYAYVTSAGATLGIAVGTAVTNATTPTLPSIPQGTMILAQIDVEANVPAIISSNITDLRNFTGRLKGIQGNAGTGGVNGPATYMVDDGDEGPWGPPSSAVGPQGNPGSNGAQGALGVTMAIPGDDGEDGLVVGLPGPQGNPGAQGAQGLTGPANMPGMDGVDGDDGMHIPGGVGPQGPQGLTGAQGPLGFGPSGMDGMDGDDGMQIPGAVGITITDDTTTNATRYLTFTSATSGSITGENTSSTKLQFNPSTGAFTSTSLTPTNALGIAYGGTGLSAVGTTGNVLTSNGSAWVSSAPSGGSAMTLISTQTANNTSGYLTWTGLSGYNKYILIFENLNATTTSSSLFLQVGYGSTPTYITSNYNYYYSTGASAAATYGSASSASQITIARVLPPAVTGPWGGACTLTGFTTLANAGITSNFYTGSSANGGVTGGYVGTSSNPITAIQIYFPGGTNILVSGTASLYGISS